MHTSTYQYPIYHSHTLNTFIGIFSSYQVTPPPFLPLTSFTTIIITCNLHEQPFSRATSWTSCNVLQLHSLTTTFHPSFSTISPFTPDTILSLEFHNFILVSLLSAPFHFASFLSEPDLDDLSSPQLWSEQHPQLLWLLVYSSAVLQTHHLVSCGNFKLNISKWISFRPVFFPLILFLCFSKWPYHLPSNSSHKSGSYSWYLSHSRVLHSMSSNYLLNLILSLHCQSRSLDTGIYYFHKWQRFLTLFPGSCSPFHPPCYADEWNMVPLPFSPSLPKKANHA